MDPPPVLVIHDGVNEAMSLHGDDVNQSDGAATFRRTIIKPFLAVGATSLSCDHVVKNSDVRGRYAIGSAHKVNAIDGAAFLMENIEPFGRGLRGASSVYVTKDRPGQLRAHGRPVAGVAGKTLLGVLAVDATGDSPDFLMFHSPREETIGEQPRERHLADEIYQILLGMPDCKVDSGRHLWALMRDSGTKFTNTAARDAVDDLLLAGRIVEIPGRHKAVGYRAVVSESSASADSPSSSASSTASCGASPIESEAPKHSVIRDSRSTPKHSEALQQESDRPVCCRYCDTPIAAHMHSQIARGYCSKCAAAKAVTV